MSSRISKGKGKHRERAPRRPRVKGMPRKRFSRDPDPEYMDDPKSRFNTLLPKHVSKSLHKSLLRAFKNGIKAGADKHEMAGSADILAMRVDGGHLSPRRLALMAPAIRANARKGIFPTLVVNAASAGMRSGAITEKDLRKASMAMGAEFEAAEAGFGDSARPLFDALLPGLESGAITAKTLPATARHVRKALVDSSKSGAGASHLGRALEGAMKTGAIPVDRLPVAAKKIRLAILSELRAGHDRGMLAEALREGFEKGLINHNNLNRFLNLKKKLKSSQSLGTLVDSALDMSGGGVPMGQVFQYQREAARWGEPITLSTMSTRHLDRSFNDDLIRQRRKRKKLLRE